MLLGCGARAEEPRAAAALDVETASAWAPPSNPARGEAALALNAACERCHQDVAQQWRGSLHQQAYLSASYQRALAREPLPWCRSCHAPEADLRSEPTPALAELGVGCVTCHVVGGQILAGAAASREDAPDEAVHGPHGEALQEKAPREEAPHPVVRLLDAAPALACASCHEFPFPDAALRGSPLLMQSTVSEHRASPYASATCAECHMPRGKDGRASHAFAGARSPELLAQSVRVALRRAGPLRLQLELSQVGVGHALPTGDLFRRIEVGVELVGGDYQVLARDTRHLGRHFRTAIHGGVGRRELLRDDRLPPDGSARQVTLELSPSGPLTGDERLAWWVSYQRVATPDSETQTAALEAEVMLASGVLPLTEDN
ncbi:MAG: hypothetical protein KIT72_16945 [Polyangiaceae bacterium]|nr:hypothetical protein [Polyangiaceae bacterium]